MNNKLDCAGGERYSHFELLNIGANCLDLSNTFVTKHYVCVFVMEIGATNAGVRDLDEDFVVLEVGLLFVLFLDNLAVGCALEEDGDIVAIGRETHGGVWKML